MGATGRVLAARHKKQALLKAEEYRKHVSDARESGATRVRARGQDAQALDIGRDDRGLEVHRVVEQGIDQPSGAR